MSFKDNSNNDNVINEGCKEGERRGASSPFFPFGTTSYNPYTSLHVCLEGTLGLLTPEGPA